MSSFLSVWTYLQLRTTEAYEQLKENQKNEKGLVAIEYVVLGGLVVGALVTLFILFGPKLQGKFDALLP
jgi:Flp pilus assembly pilin Flp